jgi:hypothetical protein
VKTNTIKTPMTIMTTGIKKSNIFLPPQMCNCS